MHAPVTQEAAAFIRRLPKTETHLHIEGALPFRLLQGLDPERFREPPESWALDFKWSSFEAFETHLIEHAVQWFTSPERYYEAAKLIFEDHLAQNVRYVETSFHAGIIEFPGIPGREILAAIRSAAPEGLEVRVFMGMARNSNTEALAPVLESCLEWEGLSGIDLHGVENMPLEDWTPRLWRRARDAGLIVKAHAGEFGPAGNVRESIEVLGSRRIQHGVRTVEDEAVMQLARDQDVTFDLCPISNVKLNVVPGIEAHPIRILLDAGLRCTVSTDDPFSFGNSVIDEYNALHAGLGFTREELARLSRNGFEVALVDEATRKKWLAELEQAS
ncbi:MAG: adenosine deaminase family protein [Opitutales bacterium]